MRLLLDTQIALWWLAGDARLKRATRERIAASTCFLSVASVWEVAIKHRIGKLPVAPDVFAGMLREAGAVMLPVSETHAASYARLPAGHDDPFDLLLIAVAQTENLCLLTADRKLLDYAGALHLIAVGTVV
jgi:PIN domain nuclease of toxin-antitoxin system